MSYQGRNISDPAFRIDTTNIPQFLAGRLAIVTGCTRGIGLEITLTLASHGCLIIGTYLKTDPTRLSEIIPTKFVAVQADIRTPSVSVPTITTALKKEFPGKTLDILVNNAAEAPLGPISCLSADSLSTVFTANSVFPALLVQALLPHFSKSSTGRVINITSEGTHLGRPNTTAYSASKAALESMTRTWAKELGHHYGGMTVNALAPGMIETDLWRGLPEARKEYWVEKLKDTPVQPRIGGTKDVAGVVAFLASDQAGWVSGQVLAVGGGNLMIV
ncbi:NAD(P)-binding protein [Wilcoxina mikolae CBS 423.85]|nr:NAD(P)-binding protein [Wilcoxina mikolae CBS 423.85]